MTPWEFVRWVFYEQEKVMLDFHPQDDKYKEVILEANGVINTLQKDWDWPWLREKLVLGPTTDPMGPDHIPAYKLPEWAYKVASMDNDCVRLHLYKARCGGHCSWCGKCMDEKNYIEVPYKSDGSRYSHRAGDVAYGGQWFSTNPLTMVKYGTELHFSRPLEFMERNRLAVTDVIRRMEPLHICDHTCNDPCEKIEKSVFDYMPDPYYMVVQTAALHAEGSPPAQGRLVGLADRASKMLSAMRGNAQDATEPDIIERPWNVRIVDPMGSGWFF